MRFISKLGARVVLSKAFAGRLYTKRDIAQLVDPRRTDTFSVSFTKAILLVSTENAGGATTDRFGDMNTGEVSFSRQSLDVLGDIE